MVNWRRTGSWKRGPEEGGGPKSPEKGPKRYRADRQTPAGPRRGNRGGGPTGLPRGGANLRLPLLNPPQATRAFRKAEAFDPRAAPLGRFLAEKISFQEASKKISNFDAFSTSILERLGSVFGGQDGSQIDQKSINIWFPSLLVSASFFISMLVDFWSQLRSPKTKNSLKFYCFLGGDFRRLQDKIHAGCHFGAYLAPFCLPKSTKNAPKGDPKRHQKCDHCFVVFGSVLASNLGPKTASKSKNAF